MTAWTDIENRFKEICDRYTNGNEGNQEVIANALLRRLEKALEEDHERSTVTEAEMFSNGVTNNEAVTAYIKALRIMPDGQFKINNHWGIIQPRMYNLKDFTAGRVSGRFYSALPLEDIIEKMNWSFSRPDSFKATEHGSDTTVLRSGIGDSATGEIVVSSKFLGYY